MWLEERVKENLPWNKAAYRMKRADSCHWSLIGYVVGLLVGDVRVAIEPPKIWGPLSEVSPEVPSSH